MNAQYKNMNEAAKAVFIKNIKAVKQDDEEQMFATLVKIYNRFKEDDNPYEIIYMVDDKKQFIKELERAEDATFEELIKARSMGARYVWQVDGLQEVYFDILESAIIDEFEKIFDYAMMYPKDYADFLSLCLAVNMFDQFDSDTTDPSKADKEITINGKTYNKCYFSNKQWNEIENPCAYCSEAVQLACARSKKQFCCEEHCCFIDLGSVLGEQ